MRLIDADSFKRFLQALCKAGAPYYDVIQLLDKEPTAYDISKVVAELEDMMPFCPTNSLDERTEQVLLDAIEIVKRGGVE